MFLFDIFPLPFDIYEFYIFILQIGDLGPGTYNLTAHGVNGLEFVNTTGLEYAPKSHSVFIQTDKAVYKPGHKIQFRVIVLNAHLKPSVTGALDVYITVSNSVYQQRAQNFLLE